MSANAFLARGNQTPRLPFAPYAREIFDALAAGRSLNARLFALRPNPWKRACRYREDHGRASTLVLPEGTDPLALRWPPLSDLVADVTGLDGDSIKKLAHALVRDGLRLAYLIDSECAGRSLRVVAKL